MAEETRKTGEVVQSTATEITVDDVLGNEKLMTEILKSKAVLDLVQSESDRVRTKASKEKADVSGEFAKYKLETDTKIAELTKFQKDFFKTEILKKSGLDVDLWQYVTGETEEDILKSAKDLTDKITKLAEKKVGGKPQTEKTFTGITKEQFGKMSFTERAELYQKDFALYQELTKGE